MGCICILCHAIRRLGNFGLMTSFGESLAIESYHVANNINVFVLRAAVLLPFTYCVQADIFILPPLKSLAEHMCLVTSLTEL